MKKYSALPNVQLLLALVALILLYPFLERMQYGIFTWFEMLYFSFTCLTSVGFGEITPVSDHARSLVMIQQLVGVLYLAIVISRLISMNSRMRK